jgi:hypothetical protein
VFVARKSKEAKAKIYQDKSGKWRWSFIAPNGRVIADSSEGYNSKRNVLRAFESVIYYMSGLNFDFDLK